MDLKITDLTQEQYNKIMDFSKTVVERKFSILIYQDDCVNFEDEMNIVFERPEIEDIKILNCLKDYTLCKKYEVKNEDYWDKEELLKEGYELYYAEATIHSGIWLYEYTGALRDRWDSRIAGIVAIKHTSKDVHFGSQVFKSFLETWQKCNDGDFYGFRVFDNFGDELDSCWGFWDKESMWDSVPDVITKEQFEEACNNIQY